MPGHYVYPTTSPQPNMGGTLPMMHSTPLAEQSAQKVTFKEEKKK